jgi:glycosyltransferase involved in cell wall biosynthesis
MRILFITARVPGADFRGDQMRSLQQLVHLGSRHQITLVALDTSSTQSVISPLLAAACERIIIVKHPRWLAAVSALRAFFTGRPFQVEAFWSRAARAAVGQCLQRGETDLIHLQLVRTGYLAPSILPIPCVIDLVDALSLNMQRRASRDRGLIAWIAANEAKRLHVYERKLLALVAAATVSSPVDRATLGSPVNLYLADNGVDLNEFPFVSTTRRDLTIVFVGNLGYFPNVDAILGFAQSVLPAVTKIFPDVRLSLVGARPHRLLRQLADQVSAIDLVGPVARTHPYVAAAAMSIAPMRAGSGQQLKVLEAMASGTPTLVSSHVSASLCAQSDVHFLVADSASEMVAATCRLLRDADLRQRIALAARQLVERRYTWRHSAQRLEDVWQRAAQRNRAA